MTSEQVISILETTGIPVYYDHAPLETLLPFIVCHITQPYNFSADNMVYVETFHYRVYLYTRTKDTTLEGLIKTALNNASIYWIVNENFIDADESYEVEFEFDEFGSIDDSGDDDDG